MLTRRHWHTRVFVRAMTLIIHPFSDFHSFTSVPAYQKTQRIKNLLQHTACRFHNCTISEMMVFFVEVLTLGDYTSSFASCSSLCKRVIGVKMLKSLNGWTISSPEQCCVAKHNDDEKHYKKHFSAVGTS